MLKSSWVHELGRAELKERVAKVERYAEGLEAKLVFVHALAKAPWWRWPRVIKSIRAATVVPGVNDRQVVK